MKTIVYSLASLLFVNLSIAQEEKKSDTTRMNFGKVEMVIIDHSKDGHAEVSDTIDASPSKEEAAKNEAHWAGFDVGVMALLNSQNGTSFQNNPYWENDPAKSFNFGLNLMEHKFSIYKHYVGITTGLGFNFTQVGFKNNYVLTTSIDSVYGVVDTLHNYSKNKLKACYLQVPLLLEFNTNINSDKNFYLCAGVVGGVRLTSKIKREAQENGVNFEEKMKGTYALNSFKLDATVRMGYADWGCFATYALVPLFEPGKTVPVHPFTVGLTHNF